MENNAEANLISKETPVKKKKKSNLFNLFIILTITICYSIISLWGDFNSVIAALKSPSANYNYFIVLFLILTLYFLVDGLILFIFARLYTASYKYHRGLATSLIGQFYASITPSSSGRQFSQVVTFKKQGVTVSSAASVMVMYYIIYQIVLILFGVFSMIYNFESFFLNNATIGFLTFQIPIWVFAILGFGVSASIVIILFLASFSKKFHSFIINNVIGLLSKIKIVKKPEEKKKSLLVTTENFRIELRRLSSNIPVTILIMILFIVKFLLYYSITYFVALMLDPSLSGFKVYLETMTRSSFHQMVVGIIPIPGGAGISEYLFEIMFIPIYDGFSLTNVVAFVKAVQLIWRTFTFYISLLIGGFVAALYKSSMEEVIVEEGTEMSTFADVQVSTYAERKVSSDTAYATSQLSVTEIKRKMKRKK